MIVSSEVFRTQSAAPLTRLHFLGHCKNKADYHDYDRDIRLI